jgi:hypothetical protein
MLRPFLQASVPSLAIALRFRFNVSLVDTFLTVVVNLRHLTFNLCNLSYYAPLMIACHNIITVGHHSKKCNEFNKFCNDNTFKYSSMCLPFIIKSTAKMSVLIM